MSILLLLIPIGLAMGLVGLGAFAWCLRSGQYEDLTGAAVRVLHDEESPPRRPDAAGTTEEANRC